MGKPISGVVSVCEWTMGPGGDEYRYFWFSEWRIVTDEQIAKAVPGFRSHERWGMLAERDGEVLCVLPGCRVTGFVRCEEAPVAPKKVLCL